MTPWPPSAGGCRGWRWRRPTSSRDRPGTASLLDLFDGRQQLIVYRAFLEPGVHGWPDHACVGCSMVADQVAHVAHLNARDTTLVFASRAPQADIQRVKARMGWEMPWYTMKDGFDVDFGVDEWHGTNAFIRDGDRVFRTYFINSRGDEALGSTWSYLDMTALGRQEEWEDSPEGYPQGPPVRVVGVARRGAADRRGPARPRAAPDRRVDGTAGVVVIAHVGGLPVEEVLPALMSGVGAWLILRLTSLAARRRPTRHPPAGRGGADGDTAHPGPNPPSDRCPEAIVRSVRRTTRSVRATRRQPSPARRSSSRPRESTP